MISRAAMKCLQGKTCVVTGSTDGIGLSVAKKLGFEGAKVVVSSRKQANVDEAVTLLKNEGIDDVLGVVCHVAKDEDRKRLFEETLKKFGGIDVLVSNAAVNPATDPILDTPVEVWDKIFDVNVRASFLLAKEVKPHIVKRNGGSIVFISSIGAYHPYTSRTFQNFPHLGAYAVSKTALVGLTHAVSLDCAKNNIRVNCVAPGLINTNFATELISNDEDLKNVLGDIPMKRLGEPDEVAGVVAFLVSENASYITGECIAVAGGVTRGL